MVRYALQPSAPLQHRIGASPQHRLEQQGGYPTVFCVIYKFTVKPDHDNSFREHWLSVTQWYYRHAGSLGSRLHRASPGEYMGYAQWPSRTQWAQPRGQSEAELQAHRQAMRACCESIEVLYELDVTDDWLQPEIYRGEG